MDLLLIPSYCSLMFHLFLACCYSLVFQLIAPLCFSSPLKGLLLFLFSHKAVPPPVYKGPLLSTEGLKPNLIPNPS
jgi:hypothetical protein